MPASTIFCPFCGVFDSRKFGLDRRRRQRYQCLTCRKVFTRRTKTFASGSQLSDRQWHEAIRKFCKRAGESAEDMAREMQINRKTAQRLNKTFRSLVKELEPKILSGPTEWDESVAIRFQWVSGGVSRALKQCVMQVIPDRSERTLVPMVEQRTDGQSPIFTDEWLAYGGLVNRWSVCHAKEFVRKEARFVHTNSIEGAWGHLKPLGRHVYRGFPRSTLDSYLSEFMFRYNLRDYETRVSVLSALLTRKINSLLV